MAAMGRTADRRAARAWPGSLVCSGLAHVALLAACLLIQPDGERSRPALRVRLVEERSAAVSAPIEASAPTVPARPRAAPLAPALARSRHPIPLASAREVSPPSPSFQEAARDVPVPVSAEVAGPVVPPDVPPAVTPAPPAVEPTPVPTASGGNPGISSLPEGRDGGSRQGGGTLLASTAGGPESRGIFVVNGHGDGAGPGVGGGSGTRGDSNRGGSGGGVEGNGVGGRGAGGGESAPGPLASRGGGAPTGGADAGHLQRVIRDQIERARIYPDTARREGLQGTVLVRFRVGSDGAVTAVEIARSSGHELLDQASADTVRRAAPYPAFPGWIRIPLAYRLDR